MSCRFLRATTSRVSIAQIVNILSAGHRSQSQNARMATAVYAPIVEPGRDGSITAQQVRLPADKLATLLHKGARTEFKPDKHLASKPTSYTRHTMTDLGLDTLATDNKSKAPAVIDFAMTEPFRLLSDEGVEAMRQAVFSEEVLKNSPFKVKDHNGIDYTHWELRNTSKQNKFIRDFWRSSSVNDRVVDALGYDVVPTMDVELGHVNLQTPLAGVSEGVTGWHTDENCQFVCIVMLSDAKNMVGGETAFRRADGTVALIKYPAAGYAIVMQGLNILHSVTNVEAAEGERMTMVTSYQPADYKQPQNGLIKSLHPLGTEDDTRQMCGEYAAWRLEVLSKRMADLAAEVDEDRKSGKFNLEKLKKTTEEFSKFLTITVDETDPAVPY